jgi:hypothetical protein
MAKMNFCAISNHANSNIIANSFNICYNTRINPKTCFVARSSEKSVVKAGGEKGSEVCWSTLRTFFADNADPRALQPIAVERGFGMDSNYKGRYVRFSYEEGLKCIV